ncbi:hypothetical protein BDV98DRAFT_600893 [Pterulicium gracile]|uniref:Uncharacterized protein n=1 Tax=Pterulicium gracile TaxID=1884261 RepID=A0A5C3QVW1_9AGAR|nr:hypothetical protein BDV98DRAFT_600893 [Pterula gracilis]
MVQITSYTEELTLSAYVQKRREIEPVIQAIATQGASKLPFRASICFQIDKACPQPHDRAEPSRGGTSTTRYRHNARPSDDAGMGIYSLLNMMALYCSHGTQLLDLVLSTPKVMGVLALHHVRGHLPMEFAQRIQHITHIVGHEDTKKIVAEMVEVLAKATVRQITLHLDSPMENWGPKETLHLTTQLSFMEAITLGHNGVRDVLINMKVVPLVIRIIDLYAKGLAPMDRQSRYIVRKGVSYLMSLHTVQKNTLWTSNRYV